MLTDLDKEIVDKIEQAIRLGFQIAKDYSETDYVYDGYEDNGSQSRSYYADFTLAEIKLEKKIEEMRNAALGQEAA